MIINQLFLSISKACPERAVFGRRGKAGVGVIFKCKFKQINFIFNQQYAFQVRIGTICSQFH